MHRLGRARGRWADVRLLLTSGRIHDGSGAAAFSGGVLIDSGLIRHVFRERVPHLLDVQEHVDVGDHVICPGFVDLHTHSDVSVLSDPGCVSAVGQGITTQVVGHCGFSAAPVDARTRASMVNEEPVFGFPGVDWDWATTAEYLRVVRDARPATNIATLVGHGTVRRLVMGSVGRPADDPELSTMSHQVDAALCDGALGLSTGLSYAPGMYADARELNALARLTSRYGRRYHTHMRYDGLPIWHALAEAISVARTTGVAVNVSHLYPSVSDPADTAEHLLAAVDQAREEGLDVTFDLTVFRRGGGAWMQALPGWARDGGLPALRARIAAPADRRQLLTHLRQRATDWDDQLVVKVGHQDNKHLIGRSIGELARERGRDPADTALDLVSEDGQFWVAPHIKRQADLDALIAHPLCVPVTDGMAAHPVKHRPLGLMPKTFGTVPLVLGDYVRERRVLSLAQAIVKLTRLAAIRAGLLDRGLLAPGLAADVVVFDPERIANEATDDDPAVAPSGVDHVLVNGSWAVRDGRLTGTRTGQVLAA